MLFFFGFFPSILVCAYIYIYMYTLCMCMCMCMHVYMYEVYVHGECCVNRSAQK